MIRDAAVLESYMAPPSRAESAMNTQLVMVEESDWLNIPPPLILLVLAKKVQLVIVGEELMLYMPPPSVALVLREKIQ